MPGPTGGASTERPTGAGVAADLGYGHRTVNGFQRLMQRFGSSRAGAWMFSKSLAPLDRVVHRVTDGRTSAPEVLAGLPVIMVTTTGRRSGQARTSPLIAVPVGDSLALLGTNFGQSGTPAWVLNLEVDPHLTVGYRDRTLELVARPASDDERAEVWRNSAGIYGGYEKYQARIQGRALRIFVLGPRV
jgi:deazaflavin-dependent oxidoreductase (nitroreductase family)